MTDKPTDAEQCPRCGSAMRLHLRTGDSACSDPGCGYLIEAMRELPHEQDVQPGDTLPTKAEWMERRIATLTADRDRLRKACEDIVQNRHSEFYCSPRRYNLREVLDKLDTALTEGDEK